MAQYYNPTPMYNEQELYSKIAHLTKTSLYTPTPMYKPTSFYQTAAFASDKQASSLLARMHDPYEINSLLDVISNSAALRKNYGDASFTSHAKALRDLFVNRTWKPVSQGDFATAGINLLYNLGETLDFAGNVVKAATVPMFAAQSAKMDYDDAERILVQHASGKAIVRAQRVDGTNVYGAVVGGKFIEYTDKDLEMYEYIVNSGRTVNPYKLSFDERIKASIGLGDYGRVNFEYNTGSTLIDIFMEVVSDPGLIISASGKILSKTAIEGVEGTLKVAARQLDDAVMAAAQTPEVKTAAVEAMERLVKASEDKVIKTQALKYFKEKSITIAKRESVKPWLSTLLGDAINETSDGATYTIKNMAQALTVALHRTGDLSEVFTPRQTIDLLHRAGAKRVNNMTTTALRTVGTADKILSTTESVLLEAALTPTGVYPIYKLAKRSPKLAKWAMHISNTGAELYANAKGQRSIFSYADGLNNFLRNSRTITDGIGDELAVQYNPKYMGQFYAQMADDVVFFNELLSKIQVNNGAVVLKAYQQYMENMHHARTLKELAEVANSLVHTLGASDARLNNYAAFLNVLAPQFDQLKAMLETVQRATQINTVTAKLSIDSLPQAPILLLQKNNGDAVATFQQLDDMLFELVRPVTNLTPHTTEISHSFIADMRVLFQRALSTGEDLTTPISQRLIQFKNELHRYSQVHLINKVKALSSEDLIKTLAKNLEQDKIVVENIMHTASSIQDTRTGAPTFFTGQSSETPLQAALLDAPAVKVLFGDTDLADLEAVKRWYKPYEQQYTQLVDTGIKQKTNYKKVPAHRVHKMRPLMTQQFTTVFTKFINTPLNSRAYVSAYEAFRRTLYFMTQDMVKLGLDSAEIAKLTAFADTLKTVCPQQLARNADLLTAWKDIYVFKLEELTAMASILDDPDIIKFMQECRSGELHKLYQGLSEMPEVPEELLAKVRSSIDLANQFYAHKRFITEVSQSSLRETTKAGVLNHIASPAFMYSDPGQLLSDLDRRLESIIHGLETFVQQTKQHDESLSLDFIFDRYRDKINALCVAQGLPEISEEAHIALYDLFTTEYTLTELCKKNEHVKAALESKRKLVYFDFETQNANVHAGNTLHQYAIRTADNEQYQTFTGGLSGSGIRQTSPEASYLDKLFPGMSYDQQLIKYITTRGGQAVDETQLVQEIVQNLWEAVKDTWDETLDSYGAVLVTHNGMSFDLPILKAKLYQHDIDLEKLGIRKNFLDRVEMLDTLKILQEQKGYYHVTPDEYPELVAIFRRYFTDLADANATGLFNLKPGHVLVDEAQHLKHVIEAIKTYYPNISGAALRWQDGYDAMITAVQRIDRTNTSLGETHYFKDLFYNTRKGGFSSLTPEDKAKWLAHLESRGMSKEEIKALYGDLDTLNLSTLLRGNKDHQGYGYRNLVQTKLVDNWFVGSAARIGELTEQQAIRMTNIAKQLQRYANQVKNVKVYAENITDIKHTAGRFWTHYLNLLQVAKKNFLKQNLAIPAELQYLRVQNLSVQQQWAVLRYFMDLADDKLLSKYVVQGSIVDTLRKSAGGVEFGPWGKRLNARNEFVFAEEYTAKYQQLLSFQTDVEQFSRYLDEPGPDRAPIFDGAAQLQMRAMEEATRLSATVSNFYTRLRKVDAIKAYDLYQKEVTDANIMAGTIRRAFLNSNLSDTLRWLADAKGLVIFREGELALEESEAFINKITGAEFADEGVRTLTVARNTYVWLSKSAGFQTTFDVELKTPTYWINGKAYRKPEWQQTHIISDEFKPEWQWADDALYFMSEGASGASLYEGFTQADLERIYNMLPAEVAADITDLQVLKNPALWKGPQYNHTVLGSVAGRRQFMPYAESHPISTLLTATQRRVHDHGTKFVYAQALMSEASAIKNTSLGAMFTKNIPDTIAWAKKNPELHAVSLSTSKNSLGFEIIEHNLTTEAGIRAAVEANANIMTTPEFNKAWEVINQNIWSETTASAWLALVRLFKIGYLTTPGTWGRNLLDSFIKNMQVSGEGVFETARAYATAWKDLQNYDDAVDAMLAWSKDGTFPVDSELAAFFQGNTKMSYDRFQYLHRFFNDAAAGGEAAVYQRLNSASQKQYWEELLQAGAVTPQLKKKFERRKIFNHITNKALAPMNEIERTARLAEYHLLTKQGLANTKAIHMIEHTHYAYSVKTKFEQTMELLIPFYTFTSRNLVYWLDVIEKDPTYLMTLRDILVPLWDLGQYDPQEVEGSSSLQQNIMSGSIPVGDTDWFFKTGFSFMDALQILTNPVEQAKNRIFTPVQTVVNILLQNASDEQSRTGRQAVSNWLQETFGLRVTREQLEAKYGEWAKTYEELYPYKISENPVQQAFNIWQFIPLIGTQVMRLENAGLYYNGDTLQQLLYVSGFAAKRTSWNNEDLVNGREKLRYKIMSLVEDSSEIRNKWQEVLSNHGYTSNINLYTLDHNTLNTLWNELSEGYKKISSQIYDLLQSGDDGVWMYSRLKAALGYAGVPLGELPTPVKESILSALSGQTSSVDVRPVFQDADSMLFVWRSVKRKYGYADARLDEIPSAAMNTMLTEIASDALVTARIMTSLQEDPESRYSYAVAKNKLGLKDLKLTQLPGDALRLIEGAMLHKVYGLGVSKQSKPRTAYKAYPKKVYHKKSYVKGLPSARNTGPIYDTSKGARPSYNNSFVAKQRYYNSLYKKNYTSTGTSRMMLRLKSLTPDRLNASLRYGFKYYR